MKDNDAARIDNIDTHMISASPWFRVAYPFQWGLPIISFPAILIVFTGLVTSMSDNMGDYYACSAISNCPPPPVVVVNRAIFIEGIGSVFSAIFGSSAALSSYSSNVGSIAITKVASRRVTQMFGLCLILFSMCGKLSALFVSIPPPVMGGVFFVMTSMIIAVGLNILKDIDFESPRNLYILGISVTLGSTIPTFFSSPGNIENSVESLRWLLENETIQKLLTNGMLITGLTGLILDNTIPGTLLERGLQTHENLPSGSVVSMRTYQIYKLPWDLDNWFAKYLSFLPIYLTKDAIV